jgi:hypothetical protein
MRPPAGVRLSVLALALALTASADTLRLRDGSAVTGTFLSATADDIRFSVNGEVRDYSRADIAGIDLSPSASHAPANNSDPDWVVSGPNYTNVPFLRGATDFIPMERQVATAARSGGVYGFGGGTVYRVPGTHSPVRVRQTDRIVFIVRIDSGWNPRDFQLFRLESRMGSRQTQTVMGGGSPPALQVTIDKIGDSVYTITPSRPLAPGEYAVSALNSNDSYCFGVDY